MRGARFAAMSSSARPAVGVTGGRPRSRPGGEGGGTEWDTTQRITARPAPRLLDEPGAALVHDERQRGRRRVQGRAAAPGQPGRARAGRGPPDPGCCCCCCCTRPFPPPPRIEGRTRSRRCRARTGASGARAGAVALARAGGRTALDGGDLRLPRVGDGRRAVRRRLRGQPTGRARRAGALACVPGGERRPPQSTGGRQRRARRRWPTCRLYASIVRAIQGVDSLGGCSPMMERGGRSEHVAWLERQNNSCTGSPAYLPRRPAGTWRLESTCCRRRRRACRPEGGGPAPEPRPRSAPRAAGGLRPAQARGLGASLRLAFPASPALQTSTWSC